MRAPDHYGNRGIGSIRAIVGSLLILGLPILLLADTNGPTWWREKLVQNETAQANDYAAVNQGQVKNIATGAVAEMDDKLPGGAGDELHNLVAAWGTCSPQTNDYAAANLGQLKAVARPFLDRLLSVKYYQRPIINGTYPWNGGTANDYAMANIGQAKNLFSFNLTGTGANGLPEWWQNYYFGDVVSDPNALAPSGILINETPITIREAYENHLNPIDFYDGSAPSLTITNGNNQTGNPGAFLSAPLVVRVMDNSGNPMAKAPVTFAVTQGGGTLQATATGSNSSTLGLRTNKSGYAIVYFRLPSTVNTQCQIACAPTTGSYGGVVFTQNSNDGSGGGAPPTLPSGDRPEGPPTPPVVSYPAIDVTAGSGISGYIKAIALGDDNNGAFISNDGNGTYTAKKWINGEIDPTFSNTLPFPEEYNGGYWAACNIHVTPNGTIYGDVWNSPDDDDGMGNSETGYFGNFCFQCINSQTSVVDNQNNGMALPCDLTKLKEDIEKVYKYCPSAFYCCSKTGNSYAGVYGSAEFDPVGGFFISCNGGMTDISGTTAIATYAMNDNGFIINYWTEIWNGSEIISTGDHDKLIDLNNNDQVIGINESTHEGFIWQGGTRTVFSTLIPEEYDGEISGITPRLLSNANAEGIIHILLDASFTDPVDGSTSPKTYVLSGPWDALSAETTTLQEVQLPDGMSSSDIKCINANGVMAFIHNGTSGSSMTANRMTSNSTQTVTTAASSGASLPAVGMGPPINIRTSSQPYAASNSYPVGPVNNIVSVWPGYSMELQIDLNGAFTESTLPPNSIQWSAPGQTIAANKMSASLWWATPGTREVEITVFGVKKLVVIDVPDVGSISEVNAAALNPIAAAIAVLWSHEAQSWAAFALPDDPDNTGDGRANALQHSYWNALMASDGLLGPVTALFFSTAHEYSNMEIHLTARESTMDLHNNYIGSLAIHSTSLGRPDLVAIQTDLRNRLDKGDLWILEKDIPIKGLISHVIKSNGKKIYSLY